MKKISESTYSIKADIGAAVSFAFVSDLHDCDYLPILQQIKSRGVDAILVGGDFIHDHERYARGIAFLESAAAVAPTFFSLGNHEKKFDRDIRERTASTGAVLLDNSSCLFRGVNIGGLSSGFYSGAPQSHTGGTPAPDTDWLKEYSEEPGYKLLLCHHPEYYDDYISPLPIALMVSGHAHGGQWRFFGRGAYAPGQGLFPRYTSGIYDGRLIVSRGIGNPYIIPRINNPPEIVFIDIDFKRRSTVV